MKIRKKNSKIVSRKIQAAVLYVVMIPAKMSNFGLYIDSGSFFEEKIVLIFVKRTFPKKVVHAFFG